MTAPILILHGLLGSGNNWRTVKNHLIKQGHQVYTPDARNHGEADHKPIHDYPSQRDDLLQFMDEHAISRATLIGHSMGGKTALYFAMTYPECVNQLIIIDIAPIRYNHNQDHIFKAMQAINLEAGLKRAEVQALLATQLNDPTTAAFLAQNYRSGMAGQAASWRVNLPVLIKAGDGLYGFPDCAAHQYEGNVSVISGGQSDYVREDGLAAFQKFFPQFKHFKLDGAGHWPHSQAYQEFMDILLPLL